MEPTLRRALLGILAALALLALVGAGLVVAFAPTNAATLLLVCIGALIVVLVAEVIVILVTRAPPTPPATPTE